MDYSEQQKIESESNQGENPISEIVHNLITRLPHKLKETALLVFCEGMNHKEASVILNCSEKTVSWRIFEVKKKLKSHLNKDEVLW